MADGMVTLLLALVTLLTLLAIAAYGFADHQSLGWAVAIGVMGALLMSLSGLCSGSVIVGAREMRSTVITVSLIVGGVPFLIGACLIRSVVKWRRARASRQPDGHG